jgi:glucose uptake protein GlcU
MYGTGISLMTLKQRETMRLFKTRRMYVYAACVYGLNALYLVVHSVKKTIPIHRTPSLSIVLPQAIGMLLLAILALAAIRKTSSAIEKSVLTLTGAICILFLMSVLYALGCSWADFPFSHLMFVAISCAAALLASWRVLQVPTASIDNNVRS